MRSITFIPAFWNEVRNGHKTQTRRRHRRWLKLKRGDRIRVFQSGMILEMTKDAYTEKLKDISKADLVREGICGYPIDNDFRVYSHRFFGLWDEIYKDEDPKWLSKSNPEIVVLNFKVIPRKKNGV